LYAENALLATGDLNFVEAAIENNFRHAGIIVIEPEWDNEEAEAYIETEGKHAWRRRFIYVHHDGVTIDHNTEEEHFHSWESLQ
jgi:hypothetical protein